MVVGRSYFNSWTETTYVERKRRVPKENADESDEEDSEDEDEGDDEEEEDHDVENDLSSNFNFSKSEVVSSLETFLPLRIPVFLRPTSDDVSMKEMIFFNGNVDYNQWNNESYQ